jgi:membrane glycosyltransferase
VPIYPRLDLFGCSSATRIGLAVVSIHALTSDYAIRWFAAQILITLAVVILALYVFRDSTAEQALRSREFLATPNHYRPADMLKQAQELGDSASGAMAQGWNEWWGSRSSV